MESFGARLRGERERRGITLEDIASSTKIGTRMLRALEEEHFEQLPGGIFNKGFVRAYARHLGMDEEQTIADYLAASGIRQPEKGPETVQEAEVQQVQEEAEGSTTAGIPWGVFAVALLIVALGFAVWGFYSRQSRKPAAPATSAASVTAGLSRANPKQSRSSGSAGNRSPAREEPIASSPVASEGQASAAPAPGAFLVLVKAREDSWLTITADGTEIMHDTLVAPAEKSVQAQKQIVIRAGNVGGLEFSFNGNKLPPQGDYDEVKTLTFDANGLQPPPAIPPAAETAPPQP